jgi:hypothetical protein
MNRPTFKFGCRYQTGRKSVTLFQRFGDHMRNELVLLAPEECSIPAIMTRRYFGRNRHSHWLNEVQRVRGRIYLEDGALKASQLTADGRHVQATDYDSWHLLVVDGNGEVQGCARYRHLIGNIGFDDLGVRESWLAQCEQWGSSLRAAVQSEIARAKQGGMAFSEVGGWAIVPEKRCTTEALGIAMATYSLAQLLGGCVGISTATQRHRSSAILRRIGGRSLECGGTELPSYYDPQYRCQMEVLRFDSNLPDPSCQRWVEQLRKLLGEVAVVVGREPVESLSVIPSRPTPLRWPAQPQIGWVS